MNKKATNSKGLQKTRERKESILIQYKDDLIEIYNNLNKAYKIDKKSKSVKEVKDIITMLSNVEGVKQPNITNFEKNLEELLKEVDRNLYNSIVKNINNAK